jgi:hypothetical protein
MPIICNRPTAIRHRYLEQKRWVRGRFISFVTEKGSKKSRFISCVQALLRYAEACDYTHYEDISHISFQDTTQLLLTSLDNLVFNAGKSNTKACVRTLLIIA